MTNDLLPIVVWDDADAATRSRILTRNGLAGALSVRTEFGASIRSLLDDVRADGGAALVRALRTFDHVPGANVEGLRVGLEEIASARVSPESSTLESARGIPKGRSRTPPE